MKRSPVKITALLLTVLLTSCTIYALGNDDAEIEVHENTGLDGSVPGSDRGKTAEELRFPLNCGVIVEENIQTVCDSIKILPTETVKADDSLRSFGQTDYSDDTAVCEVGIQTYVVLDNLALPLFPTFYDPDMALELTKDRCGTILNDIKTTYGLDDLSLENWREYQENMWSLDQYVETDEQFCYLRSLVDRYDILCRNNYLVSLAASADSVYGLLSNDDFLSNLSYFVTDDLETAGIIERIRETNGGYRTRVVPESLTGV